MVNRTVKKLRTELEEKDKSVRSLVLSRDDYKADAIRFKEKADVLESQSLENRSIINDRFRSMEDQVTWMRNFIEALTIDPKVVYAKTDRDVRMRNQERKDRREDIHRREIENRRYMQAAKNPDTMPAMDAMGRLKTPPCICGLCKNNKL